MCLIELKNAPKPIVSCSMNAKSILNNGEIFTNSPLVKKARENIMEFLLLNHPLDCPICDQGGECDLQDQALFFGFSKKRFYNFKRIVTNKNIGPIVKTVMSRCIHCTRCVRFATEIAGIEDLGVYGRGMNSEIGTYVTKVFNSELSGNIIDLCPVGALTQKPYPFVSRNWELKNVKSIDFTDGFGLNTQIFLKNNQIVKILPGFNLVKNTTTWISDKTRFSFDGMFSPERILNNVLTQNNQFNTTSISWKNFFRNLIKIIYFQDHLNKHYNFLNSILFIFNSNISLETLNILQLISNKFNFIKIRKIENLNTKNDLESTFLLTDNFNKRQLNNSNLCLLIGVNTRYEGYSLNLTLRQRYLKGNFKLINLGSLINLTYPSTYLGLNFKVLKEITEGNHPFCKDLTNYENPSIVCSSELFERLDGKNIQDLLYCLKSNINKFSNNTNINILNTSLNLFGVNYLNNYTTLRKKDLINSIGLYYINDVSKTIKKFLDLKLLNYFKNLETTPLFVIEQNNGFSNNTYINSNVFKNIYNYTNLPNNIFFESSSSFFNTEGILKKNKKIINTKNNAKEDWLILRKILSSLNKVSYTNDFSNFKITYNIKNFINFKNFTGLLYYSVKNLNQNLIYSNNVLNISINKKFKSKQIKIYNSNVKLWLDDFFIKGKDSYSKYSSTMIKCSKLLRIESTNFQ